MPLSTATPLCCLIMMFSQNVYSAYAQLRCADEPWCRMLLRLFLTRPPDALDPALSTLCLPITLTIRWSFGLFLQEDDQCLQTGEAATFTGVWVREGRQPDQTAVAAYLPQTKQIGKVSRCVAAIAGTISSAVSMSRCGSRVMRLACLTPSSQATVG